jgi:hypothetical protein
VLDGRANSPTTAAKSRYRSESVSVAFDAGRFGILLAKAGTSRTSSEPWPHMGEELVLGSVGDVVAERFGEELVWGGEVLLAVAEQHASSGVEGSSGRLGHEGGLAQSGLARDEQHLAPFARGHALGGVGYRLHLGVASHHTHGGAWHGQTAGQAGWRFRCRLLRGAPRALRRLDRVG